MLFRNNLKTIIVFFVLIIIGSIGLSGCRVDHSHYHYNGKIDEDHVVFKEKLHSATWDDNILTVTRPDSTIIKYVDRLEEDLKLEYIQITKGDKTITYDSDTNISRFVLAKAQERFDVYMEEIKQINLDKILENLE